MGSVGAQSPAVMVPATLEVAIGADERTAPPLRSFLDLPGDERLLVGAYGHSQPDEPAADEVLPAGDVSVAIISQKR